MPKLKGTIVVLEGTAPWVQLEDGRTMVIGDKAIARSRAQGPGGKPVRATDLVRGVEVELEVRGQNVDKLLAFHVPKSVITQRNAELAAERDKAEEEARREATVAARERAYGSTDEPPTNAYSFLPFATTPPDDRFGAPIDRTRPAPGRRSGRIVLELDVASPVAVFGSETRVAETHQARSDKRDGANVWTFLPGAPKGPKPEHRRTTILRDAAGKPTIPGSSLKGVLRSWMEAITSSERSFDASGIAWRDIVMPDMANGAREMGILELGGVGGSGLRAQSDRSLPAGVTGTIRPCDVYQPPAGDARNNVAKGRARLASLVRDFVNADGSELVELRHGMRVRRRDAAELGWLQLGVGAGRPSPIGLRVLFEKPGAAPVTLSRQSLRRWWEAHRAAGETAARAFNETVAGRKVRVHPPDARELRSGDPVFYWPDGAETRFLGVIRGGRWAVDEIDTSRVPTHRTTRSDDDLDPARRTFGVVPERDQEALRAWAGRVRVGSASYVSGNGSTETFTLLPLSTPKVQAAGFYLTTGRTGAGVSWREGGRGQLRGTKVYWHQLSLAGEDGSIDVAERVRRTAVASGPKGEPALAKSNATVEALLDGTFRTEIWFEDLAEDELGALLLACSLRFTEGHRDRGWKIGLGKPLGLGSLRNRVLSVEVMDPSSDPVALGLSPLPETEIDEITTSALQRWLVREADRTVFDGIASHETVRDLPVGYPEMGSSGRVAAKDPIDIGAFRATPTAAEVIDGATR